MPIQAHTINKSESYEEEQKTQNSEYSVEGKEKGWRPGITQAQVLL